jgi:hypothetical protein
MSKASFKESMNVSLVFRVSVKSFPSYFIRNRLGLKMISGFHCSSVPLWIQFLDDDNAKVGCIASVSGSFYKVPLPKAGSTLTDLSYLLAIEHYVLQTHDTTVLCVGYCIQ